MTIPALSRLEHVELREKFKSEASDFTPWLAEEDNITLLGDTIGLDLQVEAQEKDVGPFRADILCKDTADNTWVLIENQLERTDHTHLGQLMTYAAGLKAVTIVWIAQKFTEEHRAAIDWLNEITDSEFKFFALEVELWRIGDSQVAPKFNLVSKPNEWSRAVAKSSANVLSESRQIQVRFWSGFKAYAEQRETSFRATKALPQNWMNIAIGRTGYQLTAIASMYDTESQSYNRNEIRAEFLVWGEDAKERFSIFEEQKQEIEEELGFSLEWYKTDEVNNCRAYIKKSVVLADESDSQNQYQWLMENLNTIHRVFQPRVRSIN